MKRILSFVLLSLILLLSCACAENIDITGEWYFTAVEVDGCIYPPTAYDVLPTQGFTLSPDGTYTLNAHDGKPIKTACWTFDGITLTVSADDKSIQLQFDGDRLTCPDLEDDCTQTLIFTRTDAAPQFYNPGSSIDAQAEAFTGQWECFCVNLDGSLYYAEALDLNYRLTVDEKKALLTHNNGYNDITTSCRWKMEDGALCAGEESYLITDKGCIAWPTDVDGLGATIYFRRSTQETAMPQMYEPTRIRNDASAISFNGRWQLFAAWYHDTWAMNLPEQSLSLTIAGTDEPMRIEIQLPDDPETATGTARMEDSLLYAVIEDTNCTCALLDDGVLMMEIFIDENDSLLTYFKPMMPVLPVS